MTGKRVTLVQLPFPVLPEEPRHLCPPLGLAYLAASLDAVGHQPHIIDAVLDGYQNEWSVAPDCLAYGLPPESIAEKISLGGPDLVGLSCLFSTQDKILRAVAREIRLRLPDVPIVLGGTHSTVFAKKLVADGTADFVLRGEGELSLNELLATLSSRKGLAQVSGLTWQDSGGIHETPVQRISELDSLPLPARHQLNLDAYSQNGILHGESRTGLPSTTIFTSRGCPARCIFCSIHPVWGYKFRAMSASRVLEEIHELYEHFGIRHLLIEDDNFTFDINRAKEILRGLARFWPEMTWSAPNGVAIWRMDDELVELMALTGCKRLSLAVESGCARTMERVIGKPLNLDQVQHVISLCKRHRIRTTAFFVLGIPGESREDMLESMRFAADLDVDTVSVMTAVPLPGSPLYEQSIQEGWVHPDTPFTSFSTRNPVLTTAEFNPQWVDRLARRTMMAHAFKHPGSYIRRVVEKLTASPSTTIVSMARMVAGSLMSRNYDK
jgi:magnesium-protoporphyrin IX monomethyl ester (oxidative) cyclase